MKKILLLFAALACNQAFAQVPTYIPTDSLVGYWPFDGDANDYSGNGNNGVVVGATLIADRFGNPNKAYHFNGISAYIGVANKCFNSGWDNFTVSCWAYSDTNHVPNQNNSQTLWNTVPHNATGVGGNWGSSGHWQISYNSTPRPGFATWDMFLVSKSKAPFLTKTWTHVVYQKRDTMYYFYINGYYDTIFNCAKIPINYPESLMFGRCDPQVTGEFLWGSLDEMVVWDRVLSPQEINDVFQGIKTAVPKSLVMTDINMYPNPAVSNMAVRIPPELIGTDYMIADMVGKIVRNGKFTDEQQEFTLDDLPSGIYIFHIVGQGGKKFMLQRN